MRAVMLVPEDLRILAEAFLYPEDSKPSVLSSYLQALASRLGVSEGQEFQVSDLESLQIEYTRLFITSPQGTPAPPYASVYFSDRRLKGEGYDQALAFYQEAGWAPVEEGELADHLSYELSFLALLLEEGQRELLARFLTQHLGVWLPRFVAALKAAQPAPFYQALADLTLAVINRLKGEVAHETERFS